MIYYKFTLFLFGIILFCFSPAAAQTGNVLDPTLAPVIENWGTTVTAITKQPDGKIIAGGFFFSANGRERYGLARFNIDGTLDESFNASGLAFYNTGARAIVVQPDGKILVGGVFDAMAIGFRNIVRLNADGSVDSTFTGKANNVVHAIALQPDGKIIIGGGFTAVNSTLRQGLVRLNPSGTIDPNFTHTARTVFAIAIQPDGNIVIGGSFTAPAPNAVSRIVRVSQTGTVDTIFTGNASVDNTVSAIKIQADGKIVLGGSFALVNGASRNRLARLNADGTLDNAFSPAVTGVGAASVESVDIDPSGKILFGGAFTSVNGVFRGNVAKVNSDGTLDTSFSHTTGTNLPVRIVIAETDGNHLIGGDFQYFDGTAKYHIARLNAAGSLVAEFNASTILEGIVSEVEIQPDGKIIAAGSYFYVNGTEFASISRFNPDGTVDPTFANFSQSQYYADPIEDIEIQPDGKILVAGYVVFASGPGGYGVIRLNADGTVDNTFTPVTTMSGHPMAIKALPNGQILVGGGFSGLNGIQIGKLQRLNSNGSTDTTFSPYMTSQNAGPTVYDIVVRTDGKIVIGGEFSSINSTARNNLARLNADGTLDTTFTANASRVVFTIKELGDQSLLVGGVFTTVNGVARNRIAKLQPDGQIDSSFNVDPNLLMPHRVIKTYTDGRIIVAGQELFDYVVPNNLVVLNPDGSTNTLFPNSQWFNGGFGGFGTINDVEVQTDGRIVVGGSFTKVGSQTRLGLARLNSLNLPRKSIFDFDGDGKTDLSIFRPAVGEWWYLRSSDGGNYAAQFGNSADKLTPGDFTGDGKADIALFRPSTGEWFVLRSEDGSFYSFAFGTNGDIPAVGDFDGDNKADNAVFRPSTATWYIRRSSDGGATIQQFGQAGDAPVVADYDGDGKADIAIYRVSSGQWWINRTTAGLIAFQFGNSTDKPVQGDYTGDGKADVALFRPNTGEWFVLRSENQSFYSFPFGTNGDTPAPGDYDGDGKFDATVFRPSNNTWYSNRSSSTTLIQSFGQSGDVPVPNVFVP